MEIKFTSTACCKAIKWLRTQSDAETAWKNCERGDWMWWALMYLPGAMPERKISVAYAKWCAQRAKKSTIYAYTHASACAAYVTTATTATTAAIYAASAASAAYAASDYATTTYDYDAERKAQAEWIRKHIKCPL